MSGIDRRTAAPPHRCTAIVSHSDCLGHNTGPGHPENARRLQAVLEAIESLEAEAGERLVRMEGRHAVEDELLLAHPPDHVELIREVAKRATEADTLLAIDPDTVVSLGSWDAALAAVGCLLTAVDAVLAGEARNAFCPVRPPGHHATAQRAMGFCLFNNVAIAARYARERGVHRALIVDWDVHHGNGTEAIFYEDPQTFYLSMHQSPHYPGTGAASDRGRGAGAGTTLNLPVPPGLPPEQYIDELRSGIEAALSGFSPDIVFVSAGFDAAYGDPLAGLTLRPEDYHYLTRFLMEVAGEHCDDRLISVLEGGYNLEMLASCAAAHVRALMAA